MNPQIANGWLIVPCDAADMARVEVGCTLNRVAPRDWSPGFRDWHNGVRTAQARCLPTRPGNWYVWLRVDGRIVGPYKLRVTG